MKYTLMLLLLAGCATAARAASPSPGGAEKPPNKMEWWQRCAEHGRHIKSKRPPTERSKLIAAWAKDDGFAMGDEHAVLTREPRLGMGPCAAIAAYGRPEAVNRSVSAGGEREQWVYRGGRRLYLYFRDGKLDSYQQG